MNLGYAINPGEIVSVTFPSSYFAFVADILHCVEKDVITSNVQP